MFRHGLQRLLSESERDFIRLEVFFSNPITEIPKKQERTIVSLRPKEIRKEKRRPSQRFFVLSMKVFYFFSLSVFSGFGARTNFPL